MGTGNNAVVQTDPAAARKAIAAWARELGFDAFGVAGVEAPLRREYYLQWIAEGRHGGMAWMERNNERRLDPGKNLPEARSILCLGLSYNQPNPPRRGRIAKYALGRDYHQVIYKKLKALCRLLREEYGTDQKPYVDTGPVLEKPIAAAAGLGWQGKSTILLNRTHGTWLFLGVIITTLELPVDEPVEDLCGACNRCIDACPTGAITAPYQLDARRCISYLTIEHHGAIPEEFRRAIGDRVFGCDECLDVCPWNRRAQMARELKFAPLDHPGLRESLRMDEEEFNHRFSGTPLRRLKLSRWKRNVCVALGNIGTREDLPALEEAARGGDGLVAEHARWAIREIEAREGA